MIFPTSQAPMSPATFPLGQSRVVAGRYPPPGSDPHADAIRERRGERGITPLDANLLHVPPVAGGFNSLLGAVRTKGKLPGALREIMVGYLFIWDDCFHDPCLSLSFP